MSIEDNNKEGMIVSGVESSRDTTAVKTKPSSIGGLFDRPFRRSILGLDGLNINRGPRNSRRRRHRYLPRLISSHDNYNI